MEKNMKYMKLYENFEERKSIPDDILREFGKVNYKFNNIGYDIWDVTKLEYDNNELNYYGDLMLNWLEIKTLKRIVPVKIDYISGDFRCIYCKSLKSLKGTPKTIGKECSLKHCHKLNSLKYSPHKVYGDFNIRGCIGLTSLKGVPKNIGGDIYLSGCIGLLSDVNDYGHYTGDWGGYSREGIQEHLNSEQFSAPIWFESLMYVGAKDPEAYAQVCKDFPNETTFTDEQIKVYLHSSVLIDRKSTEEDWKVVKDILDRTKKYDHSEYRDSQLDSEWKDVF